MTEEREWTDPTGRKVPAHLVSDADRMKDELAERLVSEAEGLQRTMQDFKRRAMEEMQAGRALIFEKYGAAIGGSKGGFGMRTYDGSAEARIAVADRVVFGPELQAAKALIDECIESWVEDANPNIRVLVDDAFQVNKVGRINTQRVMGLRRLPITLPDGNKDERWERAMDAITDALIVDETATYIRFYRRNAAGGDELVSLDFSKL